MPIAKIEPSGCGEFHGNVKVGLAFYLEPEDARYNERHRLVPVIPPEGYQGEVNDDGEPLDLEEYQRWEDSLPKKWVLAPFHNHFLYLPPDITEDVIISKANLHLSNFYAAWLQELDKINGGMRKGWHTETRQRPIRYDKIDPELYKLRKPQCLDKVALIKRLPLAVMSKDIGEVFPATAIDIGVEAIDRASARRGDTVVNQGNPANDTGTIDEVEIWTKDDCTDCEVATFSAIGNDLTTRDSETIGNVTGDSKQTFSALDMDVETGDYLGVFLNASVADGVELDSSGGSGIWELDGDYIPCTSETFDVDPSADSMISLYGTGETVGISEYTKTAAISIGTAMSATRVLAAPRTASISIGDAITATRTVTWSRTSSITIGEAVTAFRGFAKTAQITIGIAMSAVGSWGRARVAQITIGTAVSATRAVTWARTASIPTGISMSATRLLGAVRTSTLTTGIAVTATRAMAWIRTSAIPTGIAFTATRTVVWVRSSALTIGNAITATRVWGVIRTANITTGIAVTASRIYGRVRTASITIGNAITASRVVAWTRSASISIGNAISATRTLAATRTASITTGVAVTATRLLAAIRTATITIGIAITVDWWTRVVALTLKVRSMALTLQHRVFALTLPIKSLALTLQHRALALTLRVRSLALTLPWRKTR